MKKIKLLFLLLMLTTASAYSQLQQIKIVSFTVKNQLPAVIDNWGNTPGSLLLVAQLPPTVHVNGIRLMVQIKSGGAIICSNNSAGGMQVDEFTTRTFSANELTSTLQGCHDLKEGSYSICVQFYNVDRVAISNEVCKEFNVEAQNIEYTPPTLINPENGKVFTETELSRPVTFRWTPVIPKPQGSVTYRLKVWRLMQGQNGTQAMRSNQPIITKDVDNITQAVVNSIITGPCRPPYMCDFIWAVQALNREGKPIGKNEGTSDPYTFKVETNTTTYSSPQLVSPNDGKAFAQNEMSAPVFFRWTPVVPKPQSVIYRLKVWQLMQGQNGTQAMRTNPPIVTKDVDNITQAVVSGIYSGPCKPPYMCDFVWQVQAVDREDHPVGSNEGKSEVWAFKVGENGATACSPPKLVEPVDGKKFQPEGTKGVKFSWGPVIPKSQAPVTYRLKVWQLMQGQNGTQAMRSNKPIVEKDVVDLTETIVNGIYTGPCKPPYMCDFIWEVQALTRDGKPACATNEGKSETFTFKVEDNTVTACTPPKLSEPADAKSFLPKDMSAPVLFRWTPLVPRPRDPVTYRLKVWQLMQGQNGTQAMRSNKPVIEKDIINVSEVSVANLYTGPCKPPYMCDFVWQVQALDKTGKPICENEGMSESRSFGVTNQVENNTPCTIPVITFPENGTAFTKDTKTIEIKGLLKGETKNVILKIYKISADPNLVRDLKQRSKGASIFSPLEMFDYKAAAKTMNSPGKEYSVKIEKASNTSGNFTASIPTAELEHGSYYAIVQNGNCPSAPMAFSMGAGCGTNNSTVSLICSGWVNGLPTYNVTIIFTNTPPLPGGLNCTTQMNSITIPAGMGTAGAFTTLPAIIPSGGSVTVTFPFTPATPSQTSVSFNYFGIWNDGYSNTSNFGSGAITLPTCVCDDCKSIQWNNGTTTSALSGNNFNITQAINPVATGLGNIVSAKAEIIAFERYVGDSCVGCNKDYHQWGNFTSGTYAGSNGSLGNAVSPVTGNTTHSMYWNAAAGGSLPSNSSFNLNISTPVLSNLTCCCDRVAVTIRYTFTFKTQNGVCKMCSFIKRYEQKKGNCPNGTDNPHDTNNPIKD